MLQSSASPPPPHTHTLVHYYYFCQFASCQVIVPHLTESYSSQVSTPTEGAWVNYTFLLYVRLCYARTLITYVLGSAYNYMLHFYLVEATTVQRENLVDIQNFPLYEGFLVLSCRKVCSTCTLIWPFVADYLTILESSVLVCSYQVPSKATYTVQYVLYVHDVL